MQQIADWLKKLGMAEYAQRFAENRIDLSVLPDLTDQDLEKMGVLLGDRRKMLRAIRDLGTTSVALSAPSAPVLAEPTRRDGAERRQLTVMFCDLVGSTALSTRHDPEDLRELIGDYHRAVADTVGRFDGFVAKYMGDGVLIYFGYPHAHEDDAERAVRAGLAVIETVGRLATPNVRLGIATGLVVVGDLIGEGAAQERGVVGETPNLAARLQGLAMLNTLVIAETTRRQIGGLFDLEDLGPQALAGFHELQRAWRVVGESGVVSRFEALRSEATPLVGRDEELDLLARRWHQAKAGQGRVVLISGEPGIGKSRLTAALLQAIEGESLTRLRYFCSPHHQDSALYPFIVQLERAAGFTRDATPDQKLGKLRGLLASGARGYDEIELLAELLSLPSSAADLNLSPQRKRQKLFKALLHQLEALASGRPVLMVFEDAHWIDPSSRELLDLIFVRVSNPAVLLVMTFRSEFQHAWSGPPHVSTLELNRLGEREGVALVERLAGNAGLRQEIVREIVERADGVPLFVEELTKAVLESADSDNRVAAVLAASPLPNLAIPATLHASLGAARTHLEKGIAFYQPEWGRSLAFRYGFNCASNCHFFLGRVLWHLGYPDHALRCAEQAVAIAAAVAHHVSRAGALSWEAALHQLRGEVGRAREVAETDLALTTEEMIPFFRAQAVILRGWALVAQGQHEEGIDQLREGLVAYRATGAELECSHWLAVLAEAYGETGQPEEAWRVIREALDHVAKTGIVYYEPELHRLEGELRLRRDPADGQKAEACFHLAVEIARSQRAKSWELRAATSLAQLWRDQGKRTEARDLLAPIYGWFTEGFDTADLKDAKALLDELTRCSSLLC
jgi:class 3 adenylate cyclase/predicted ATPase